MKYIWQDLPERKNYFTVKNTAMINLNTGKTVRQYCTNTKIAVVQKCVTPGKTYYRTQDAAHHYLNYAFEAEAFGLPNEKAPSAPSANPKPIGSFSILSFSILSTSPTPRTPKSAKKQTSTQKSKAPKGGEEKGRLNWLKKIFRRKNG